MRQLARWEELTTRKRSILDYYRERLVVPERISMNPSIDGTTEAAWMPTVAFAEEVGVSREDLLLALRSAGIDG